MWKEIGMSRTVLVHPQDMKPNGGHRRSVVLKLLKDVEDQKCSREDGYYVSPVMIKQVSQGRIIDATGCVAFTIDFTCLTCKLIKDELIELLVVEARRTGVVAACGPYDDIYLHPSHMKDFMFHHDDPKYGDCFKGVDGSVICEGSVLRGRLLGVQFREDPERCFRGVATINGDYLGVVDLPNDEDEDDDEAVPVEEEAA